MNPANDGQVGAAVESCKLETIPKEKQTYLCKAADPSTVIGQGYTPQGAAALVSVLSFANSFSI